MLSRQLKGKESIPLSRIQKIAELLTDSEEKAAQLVEFVMHQMHSIKTRDEVDPEVLEFFDKNCAVAAGKPFKNDEEYQEYKKQWKELEGNVKKHHLEHDDLVRLLARFSSWAICNQAEAVAFLSKLDDEYFKSSEVPSWAGPNATLDSFVFDVPLLTCNKHQAFYDELKELRRNAIKS